MAAVFLPSGALALRQSPPADRWLLQQSLQGTYPGWLLDGNRTGFPGLYSGLTAAVTFRPTHAVCLRPEVRYDYNGEARPFEGKHGVFTAATDLILHW